LLGGRQALRRPLVSRDNILDIRVRVRRHASLYSTAVLSAGTNLARRGHAISVDFFNRQSTLVRERLRTDGSIHPNRTEPGRGVPSWFWPLDRPSSSSLLSFLSRPSAGGHHPHPGLVSGALAARHPARTAAEGVGVIVGGTFSVGYFEIKLLKEV